MAVNKVVINDEVKIDLTSDTVSPDTLSKGITAHDKSGNVIVGTMTQDSPAVNGQTIVKRCDYAVKNGDFVSLCWYDSVVKVDDTFNFPAARVLAACHYKDDIYIFCFYNYQSESSVSSTLPFAFKAYLQAIRVNDKGIKEAGPAYQFYLSSSVKSFTSLYYNDNGTFKYELLYFLNNTMLHKDILQVWNDYIIFSCGFIQTFGIDDVTLALNKIDEKTMAFYHAQDNYYVSATYQTGNNGKYVKSTVTLAEVGKDGTINVGTTYKEGNGQASYNSYVLSGGSQQVKMFEDGTALYTTVVATNTDSSDKVGVTFITDWKTLSIKYFETNRYTTRRVKRLLQFAYAGKVYKYSSVTNSETYYEIEYASDGTPTYTSISKDLYDNYSEKVMINYCDFQDLYFVQYFKYGSSTEAGYTGYDSYDINDNLGKYERRDSTFVILKGFLFELGGDGLDPWTKTVNTYHLQGEGQEEGVQPYTGQIYGVASSSTVNNQINVIIPKEV